jgi:hypothetical protein
MLQTTSADNKTADARRNSTAASSPTAAPLSPIAALGNQATLRLQRKCDCGGGPDCDCDSKDEKKHKSALHRAASTPGAPQEAPAIVHDVLQSPGETLDPATRAFFESRFRHDFGGVRVHTDSQAAESAREVNANAYTVGRDIAFAPGRFSPATAEGRGLLAHELTHVVQQNRDFAPGPAVDLPRQDHPNDSAHEHRALSPPNAGSPSGRVQTSLAIGRVDDPLESEADRVAEHMMRTPDSPATRATSAGAVSPSTRHLASQITASSVHSVQRQPRTPTADKTEDKPVNKPAEGPRQQLYVVRDEKLRLGGVLVRDLTDLKHKLMATKIAGEWTLVLSIHGSEDRFGAQSGPDWQKNAKFYEASDIESLFGNDKEFVKWRDKYGPSYLSLVSCQVSKSFEGTVIKNLNRAGATHPQSAKGLGKGCKPIATAQKLYAAPATRAAFEKLSPTDREPILKQLKELNEKWGYYGAPPVPDDQLVHYYYDEDPKGEWVQVEVMVGTSHDVAELKSTGIPFWDRTTGPESAKFRDLCSAGVDKMRDHVPTAPSDDE